MGARSSYVARMMALGRYVAGSAVRGLAGEHGVDGRSSSGPTDPNPAERDQGGKGVKTRDSDSFIRTLRASPEHLEHLECGLQPLSRDARLRWYLL